MREKRPFGGWKKKSGCTSASAPTHPAEGPLSKYECLKMLHKWTSACSQSRRAVLERTGNKCVQKMEKQIETLQLFLYFQITRISGKDISTMIDVSQMCFFSFTCIFKNEQSSLDLQEPCSCCSVCSTCKRKKKTPPMCPYCWIKINFALIPSEAAARPFFFSISKCGLVVPPNGLATKAARVLAPSRREYRVSLQRRALSGERPGAFMQRGKKIHLARERETKSREMEDVELIFIAVWGAGCSVDRPFHDDGWKIKQKKTPTKNRINTTISLWAICGNMPHELQVWVWAQTCIDPLTSAPFPPHVHMMTWEERASFGTRITFTFHLFIYLFLQTYFQSTSMRDLSGYCVHRILPASSHRPPSLHQSARGKNRRQVVQRGGEHQSKKRRRLTEKYTSDFHTRM